MIVNDPLSVYQFMTVDQPLYYTNVKSLGPMKVVTLVVQSLLGPLDQMETTFPARSILMILSNRSSTCSARLTSEENATMANEVILPKYSQVFSLFVAV